MQQCRIHIIDMNRPGRIVHYRKPVTLVTHIPKKIAITVCLVRISNGRAVVETIPVRADRIPPTALVAYAVTILIGKGFGGDCRCRTIRI